MGQPFDTPCEERVMVIRRVMMCVLLFFSMTVGVRQICNAQCCLSGLFSGCQSCFRQAPPAYAVAPVYAPVPAPVPVPAPAPPPPPPAPVMVPVQQVSYVPETTYQTKYECVPVTTYKPSCEIDPCTGCPVECMQPVTSYQQKPVSVPVTQYRAVYSTKYVQMQPGYTPATAQGSSPFAAPVQTSPQAWGAAGADVPGQSSFAAPALPPTTAPQAPVQQVVPQSGTYVSPAPTQPQLQPTAPPALAPAPSLKPIPEMPNTTSGGAQNGESSSKQQSDVKSLNNLGSSGTIGTGQQVPYGQPRTAPAMSPVWPSASPSQGQLYEGNRMPVLPGTGPGPATGAFPRLLEPTGHTTQTQQRQSGYLGQQATLMPMVSSQTPSSYASRRAPGGYPTAVLPIRSQQ